MQITRVPYRNLRPLVHVCDRLWSRRHLNPFRHASKHVWRESLRICLAYLQRNTLMLVYSWGVIRQTFRSTLFSAVSPSSPSLSVTQRIHPQPQLMNIRGTVKRCVAVKHHVCCWPVHRFNLSFKTKIIVKWLTEEFGSDWTVFS